MKASVFRGSIGKCLKASPKDHGLKFEVGLLRKQLSQAAAMIIQKVGPDGEMVFKDKIVQIKKYNQEIDAL
mgnify:CR=1 FL=1